MIQSKREFDLARRTCSGEGQLQPPLADLGWFASFFCTSWSMPFFIKPTSIRKAASHQRELLTACGLLTIRSRARGFSAIQIQRSAARRELVSVTKTWMGQAWDRAATISKPIWGSNLVLYIHIYIYDISTAWQIVEGTAASTSVELKWLSFKVQICACYVRFLGVSWCVPTKPSSASRA